MSLTNPGRDLGRFSLLLISRKLLTLSGIPPFSTSLFRVGLPPCFARWTRSFLSDGALVWFIKITKVVPFRVRQGVFQGSVLGTVLFSLLINDLPASLPSSVSCFLYADNLAIWSSSPTVPTAMEATQGALIQLER